MSASTTKTETTQQPNHESVTITRKTRTIKPKNDHEELRKVLIDLINARIEHSGLDFHAFETLRWKDKSIESNYAEFNEYLMAFGTEINLLSLLKHDNYPHIFVTSRTGNVNQDGKTFKEVNYVVNYDKDFVDGVVSEAIKLKNVSTHIDVVQTITEQLMRKLMETMVENSYNLSFPLVRL